MSERTLESWIGDMGAAGFRMYEADFSQFPGFATIKLKHDGGLWTLVDWDKCGISIPSMRGPRLTGAPALPLPDGWNDQTFMHGGTVYVWLRRREEE